MVVKVKFKLLGRLSGLFLCACCCCSCYTYTFSSAAEQSAPSWNAQQLKEITFIVCKGGGGGLLLGDFLLTWPSIEWKRNGQEECELGPALE